MSFLRVVVAWLVMAALPMQGIAAASMLFCDQAAHSTAAQQPGHDHAAHGNDGDVDVSGQDGLHTHADHAQATLGQTQVDSHEGGNASAGGDDHACPICASCCNLVALYHAPTLSLDAARPVPPPLQGPSRVVTRDAPAPDKPPRA